MDETETSFTLTADDTQYVELFPEEPQEDFSPAISEAAPEDAFVLPEPVWEVLPVEEAIAIVEPLTPGPIGIILEALNAALEMTLPTPLEIDQALVPLG
jgi:hypothetical protein